jgi:hypothetical protein
MQADLAARNGGKILSTDYEPWVLFAKITGAADVEANGYTITDGGEVIASAVRAAEGQITITLGQKWAALLGVDFDCSIDDQIFVVTANTVSTTKTISITTRLHGDSGCADIDPDAAVIGMRIWVKNLNQ